jgi:hypothetical protein
MKYLLIILFLNILSTLANCQTQTDDIILSSKQMRSSEIKMNKIYNKIIKTYCDDSLFIRNLRINQLRWKEYINSQIQALYPDYPEGHYGSILPMCITIYKKDLIELRSKELQKWLDGTDDNDCSSSIKLKELLNQHRGNPNK